MRMEGQPQKDADHLISAASWAAYDNPAYRELANRYDVNPWQAHELRGLIGIQEGMRLLEIGCGGGELLRKLNPAMPVTCRYLGIDADREMLRHARTWMVGRAGCDAGLLQADARHLPWPDDAFDRVICQTFLANFTFQGKCEIVTEMARVTKSGGRVVAIEPTGIMLLVDEDLTSEETTAHLHLENDWRKLVRRLISRTSGIPRDVATEYDRAEMLPIVFGRMGFTALRLDPFDYFFFSRDSRYAKDELVDYCHDQLRMLAITVESLSKSVRNSQEDLETIVQYERSARRIWTRRYEAAIEGIPTCYYWIQPRMIVSGVKPVAPR